jgi:hypothetical protein
LFLQKIRTFASSLQWIPFPTVEIAVAVAVAVAWRHKDAALYDGVSKSFRTGRLERKLQMVHLSATRCRYIAILWVSLVSFVAITLCIASQRVFIVVISLSTQSGNFWIHLRMLFIHFSYLQSCTHARWRWHWWQWWHNDVTRTTWKSSQCHFSCSV